MDNYSIRPRTLVVACFMLLIAFMRVAMAMGNCIPLNNFTPLGAMALFGGAYFSRYKSIVFPLLTLWLSDIFLDGIVYHKWELFYSGFYWVYGAFALMALISKLMKPNKTVTNFITAAIAITLIHWIVTDFGVWHHSSIYPKNITGFWYCLAAAVPFEINFFAGTVIYGAVLFGAFAWLQKKCPALQLV